MSAVKTLKQHIQKLSSGEPFSATSLRNLASADNIRQVLNRMVKNGDITRVSRGIFVKPKVVPHLGKVLPEAEQIVAIIAKTTGEIITVHGAEAARMLNLSTQMPVQPTFHTTGNTRRIQAGNIKIILKHISPRKLVEPGTIIGIVILALWYLGKDNVSLATIGLIKEQLSAKDFQRLFKLIPHMPGWMVNVFYQYQQGNQHD